VAQPSSEQIGVCRLENVQKVLRMLTPQAWKFAALQQMLTRQSQWGIE
jgi:hypothetical protein